MSEGPKLDPMLLPVYGCSVCCESFGTDEEKARELFAQHVCKGEQE